MGPPTTVPLPQPTDRTGWPGGRYRSPVAGVTPVERDPHGAQDELAFRQPVDACAEAVVGEDALCQIPRIFGTPLPARV